MMTNTLKEKDLLFEFGPGWSVVKWDDDAAYKRLDKRLPGTKAVDFLAVYGQKLYFIEVKDGRKDEAAFRHRLKTGELFLEVGQKVRDSMAGLVGALHVASHDEKWEPFRQALLNPPIRVVLWLELSQGPHGPHALMELKAETNTREQQLMSRVDRLARRAIVASTRLGPHPELPALTVTNLPGAGQLRAT